MKTLFLFASLAIASVLTAQDNDLIVKTTLDSIYCKVTKMETLSINYTIGGVPDSIRAVHVYYVMKEKMSRPRYFNTSFDMDAAMAAKTPIVVQKEIPINPGVFDEQREIERANPWRAKAGRRIKTAGAITLVGLATICAGGVMAGMAPDEPYGYIVMGGGGVMMLSSNVFLIAGGNALMGY
jgi:hypothetical protein